MPKPMLFLFLVLMFVFSPNSYTKQISLMTYNIENLFDIRHDKNKEDFTYLPLSYKNNNSEVQEHCSKITNPYWRINCFNLNWDYSLYRKKINNIAKVIKSVENGRGPDIVVFQEVENITALKDLVKYGLKNLGYREIVLLEGPDKRGIDVGIISKHKLAFKAQLHKIDLSSTVDPGNEARPTRGILEATFNIYGKRLTVFGNHWPSQGNVDLARWLAAKKISEIVSKTHKYPTIVVGDFNTSDKDDPHGINEFLLNSDKEFNFFDVQQEVYSNFKIKEDNIGTHWYKGEWSSLDRIFLLQKTTAYNSTNDCVSQKICLIPDWNSFTIVKESFMLSKLEGEDKEELIPFRFDYKTGKGFSDHLPVFLKFELN